MANIATTHSTFTQINALSQLHIVRQLVFMLIVAAGIALGTAIAMWSTNSEYTALYVNMASQDSADVITALEQNGTQFKIDGNSGAITVPSDIVQRVRLQLANAGLPRASSRGYAILEDEQSIGTSNFIQQARFNRALEQELVQTIKHIQGIRDARVHLSVPKQSSFIRNSNKPSASVMIDLINTQSLGETQLMGIVHLVASSVAGLEAENVTVVDQRGTLLTHRSNSEFGTSSENIRFTRGIEENYSGRIIDILTPIVGVGNVRAQVSANLDFTLIETTEETFNPNAVVIRSEQIQEEISGSSSTGAVEPGTLSQTPPLADNDSVTDSVTDQVPSGNSNQTRISSTRNYEIDRSVSLIRTVPGSIRQISVAVLVDLHAGENSVETTDDGTAPDDAALAQIAELDQEKIDRLTQLVKNTIGFNEARGDIVSVISEQFYTVAELPPAAEIPIWQQAWVASAAKQSAAGLVVLFLIFGVLRPAMQSVVSTQESLPKQNKSLLAGASSTEIADDQESLSDHANTLPAPTAPGKSIYDENLSLAQDLVSKEPARAARMIQNWLAND